MLELEARVCPCPFPSSSAIQTWHPDHTEAVESPATVALDCLPLEKGSLNSCVASGEAGTPGGAELGQTLPPAQPQQHGDFPAEMRRLLSPQPCPGGQVAFLSRCHRGPKSGSLHPGPTGRPASESLGGALSQHSLLGWPVLPGTWSSGNHKARSPCSGRAWASLGDSRLPMPLRGLEQRPAGQLWVQS